jgi:glycosyltransferase involved in cell wall biosynthesis
MLISCILPNFNGEKYLGQAIESILAQDFPDFEFLILDDGSLDRSKEIIERFATLDKRIKPFFLKKQGLVSILNFGLENSKGKYIARMDSDDISLPNRFSTQINYLKQPNIGLVGSGIYVINESGSFLKYGHYPSDIILNKMMLDANYIAHPTVIFKRELLDKVGRYSKVFRHAEDYELWLRLSRVTNIINTKEKLLVYRQHKNSISVKYYPHQSMTDLIIKYIYRNNLDINLKDLDFINFEIIRQLIDKTDYEELICLWNKSISVMLKKGQINSYDIPDYLLSYFRQGIK